VGFVVLGSYTFSFGSERTFWLRFAMFWATFNADHYALLNLEDTPTDVNLPFNQFTPDSSTRLDTKLTVPELPFYLVPNNTSC
jgi:hypothetical protein